MSRQFARGSLEYDDVDVNGVSAINALIQHGIQAQQQPVKAAATPAPAPAAASSGRDADGDNDGSTVGTQLNVKA